MGAGGGNGSVDLGLGATRAGIGGVGFDLGELAIIARFFDRSSGASSEPRGAGGSTAGEGVDDSQATDALADLQVLAEEPLAAACERGRDDERVVPADGVVRAELQGALEGLRTLSQTAG